MSLQRAFTECLPFVLSPFSLRRLPNVCGLVARFIAKFVRYHTGNHSRNSFRQLADFAAFGRFWMGTPLREAQIFNLESQVQIELRNRRVRQDGIRQLLVFAGL